MASSVIGYYGQLSSGRTPEKTNDLILRKLGEGRTDKQADQSDFIGCCQTTLSIQHQ